MIAFWSGTVATFLDTDPHALAQTLAYAQLRNFRTSEATQLRAWDDTIALLRHTFLALPQAAAWQVLLEVPLLRLGRRADCVLLTDRAILVLELKTGQGARFEPAARQQVEDYALDLQDFHAGSRHHPIVPILVVPDGARPSPIRALPLRGVTAVHEANRHSMAALLTEFAGWPQTTTLDALAWQAAPYRPVPTIIEAARMLYARHGVAEIAEARADAGSLNRTARAITDALGTARADSQRIALFITGIPGAGKTLCGLNAVFNGAESGTTFLTGNPTLVHVLREALARDAIAAGADARAARQRMEGAIQALPRFRDHYVLTGACPAERVIVIDEAQRSWSAAHAMRKSRDRTPRLTDSEPGHLLDIMGRHQGFCAVICLVGSGQEIHDGEGGLAEWGDALRQRAGWRSRAAPDATSPDPRRRLGPLLDHAEDPALHLDVSMRAIRTDAAPLWVDAVLDGDSVRAAGIAQGCGGVPFLLTRSLPAMRAALRRLARGSRRCGLLASSGARRLRADGLGVELPHMDAQAVARWFLDRWPDIRASDALELVATEFSCQGLELDQAGLCWDADLIRPAGGGGAWRVRSFRGTSWITPRDAEAIANRLNTYRVLLTRARYETILFVPAGSPDDATRDPALYDAIAEFLLACGATTLTATDPPPSEAELPNLL